MMNEFDRIKDFKAEERKRKEFIELCIDKLYEKFPMIFTEPLEEVKKKALEKALDKYMYTPEFYNLSYDEISKDLQAGIKARIEAARSTAKNNDNNNNYNVREDIKKFNETTPSISLINNDPTPSIKIINNDPTTYINLLNYDVPKISYKNNFTYTRSILLTPGQIAALKRKSIYIYDLDKGKDILKSNFIYEPDKGKDIVIEGNDAQEIEETETEIGTMLAEVPSTEVSKENSDAIQYVKTANTTPNNQSGNVSLFNIVLTILGITSFVLVAMILNLLLK